MEIIDPWLIPDKHFFQNIVSKYAKRQLSLSRNRCIAHLLFTDLKKLGWTRNALDEHGTLRYEYQRPVNRERATKIAEDMIDRMKVGDIPEIDIMIGTIQQQDPRMIDGQHRCNAVWIASELCDSFVMPLFEQSTVVLHIFDFANEIERKRKFKVLNDNSLLSAIYKSRAQSMKEKTEKAFVQLMKLIQHTLGDFIQPTIHGAYEKFISSDVDETDLKEVVYDFVVQYRDSPQFDKFCSNTLLTDEMKLVGSPEDVWKYYEQLPIEKYPSGCVAFTCHDEKCKNGCTGSHGIRFDDYPAHGICGTHTRKYHETDEHTIKKYKFEMFKRRFDRAKNSGSPTCLLFKLKETENNWLNRTFDAFVKTHPCHEDLTF